LGTKKKQTAKGEKELKHGEVWKAEFPEPVKSRPVLILSRTSMPASRPEITVAYLTTKRRFSPVEVPLSTAADGVERDCVVNLDSINTVSKDRLLEYVCTLYAVKMREVKAAILFAFDLI
jgi:mRNA interferase MazF